MPNGGPGKRTVADSIKSELPEILCFFLLVLTFAPPLAGASFASGSDLQNQYTVTVDLPQATVYDLRVDLTVPKGLIYVEDSLAVTGATDPSQRISYPNDGTHDVQVEWIFGDVDNFANASLDISFNLLLANTREIYEGQTLGPIQAHANWKDEQDSLHTNSSGSEYVRVIEPDLDLEIEASAAVLEPGKEETFAVSVSHNFLSCADAYDVDVSVSIPAGLTYQPGTMQTVFGPSGAMDESSPRMLLWHFEHIDRSWTIDHPIQLSYRATVDRVAPPGEQITSEALLSWSSTQDSSLGRSYYQSAKSYIAIPSEPPDIEISMQDSPDPVRPGGLLNYTITYKNRGGPAPNASIEASYDKNVEFASAAPEPNAGTKDRWSLGDMDKNCSGTIKINARADPNLTDGFTLTSTAKVTSDGRDTACASATTRVNCSAPELYIEKTASDPIIRPGGSLEYTINYRNAGPGDATNVSITDIIDKNLRFNLHDASPVPTKIWTDNEGTHLWWDAEALGTQVFGPGASGKIVLRASLPEAPLHPQFDSVYNYYRIDSNETAGFFNSLETFVVHSIYVRKKAEKERYYSGDIVNYTIYYGNDLALDAEDAKLTDTLPDAKYMQFVDADPKPSFADGRSLIWNLGRIPKKSGGKILLYALIKKNASGISYVSSESVTGYGYVRFDQRLDTAKKPDTLTNCVNITATYLGERDFDASSSTIMLADAAGTSLKIQGHGSGNYSRDAYIRFAQENKSILSSTSLSVGFRPTSFSLPGGRSIDYSSKWSEAQEAKNRVTGASIRERYMYASRILRNSTMNLNKNGSVLESDTTFEGAGHVGLLKMTDANSTIKDAPKYESTEDFLGQFSVHTSFDEYGENAATDGSAFGMGSVIVRQLLDVSKESRESGTGLYRADHLSQTQTSYMARSLNASYEPVNYTYSPGFRVDLKKKWSASMWSGSGAWRVAANAATTPSSLIKQDFSGADYLNVSTLSGNLGQMKTEAEFQGRAEFQVVQIARIDNSSFKEVDLYDEYVGRYRLSRNVDISGVAHFNEPHLNVSMVGETEQGQSTTINYVITVTNDGNHVLGPIKIVDLLPQNTNYVYSSLRPSEINKSTVMWTLISLGVGMSTSIKLKLNSSSNSERIVNRVQVMGGYNQEWIVAENASSIENDWLDGSGPSPVDAGVQVGGRAPSPTGPDWRPPECFGLNCTQQGIQEDWISCEGCEGENEILSL